ncbi:MULTISPECIES: NAD-dependent succinate-semialdehyde dehydrogenase [unclassified Shinella]|uniref:NAD-dependent succinate-semialdehyde dehydrogenase n=1 Tax=unclassified Shinella TaxID=2643062 RepID=UPI00234E9A6E|nr:MULTISPECIES: NAD-dependent succinate-semialdehyde dehydrogenase [unclassified Shinella]MCO5151402.1 NAD-dependent succinate-semialdehyde dehydrogenase [Shinella sp.]MDC7266283.1 NAD-dependent succinate-semialdehyde dehydrogenase [Shinella sp. HY16]MDC7273180.1 NAD-dependent succinate-semialdehyde dehydrogenase [Shinella sp. YZ44]
MTAITSVNPATGKPIRSFDLQDDAAVDAALEAAARAQRAWRRVPVGERVALLTRMAAALRAGKARYAEMIVREMGKPIAEAEAEIEKCAYNCDFYAEHAPVYLADEPVASNASESVVAFEPLGVVLAIMPWNYPFWQYFRFVAPALAAGNGAILKHANNVPECALAVQEVMDAAGTPAGLTATLLVDTAKVAGLIADPRIAAVTLTGSTEVGAIVASQAGKALKKQVLELGGSDPFIVLADADLEAAAETAVKARYINVGQSCVNAKRFIVEEAVADRFTALFVEKAAALKIGDPMEHDTKIGPMARENLRTGLHDQVKRSLAEGAVLKLGGEPLEGDGFYYPPTVLDHVRPGMTAFREETFGPVAAIIRAKDADEAVAMANDSEYGLGAALWAGDAARGRELAARIDAGAVFVNGMTASDPRYPFGGIKRSGYGRELGVYGIREFVNIKTVWIGPSK